MYFLRRVIFCASVFVMAALLTSCQITQVHANQRSISVFGSGSVTIAPDQANMTLSVVTRHTDAAAAAAENAAKMSAVQSAIIALGIEKNAVSTSNYNVYRETNYRDGVNHPGDYRVSNQLNITVKKLDIVGDVIDAAIQAGANDLSSLVFSASDTEGALREARLLAIKQAEDAARLLAEATGARLGKALAIQEGGAPQPPRPTVMNARSKVATADTAYEVATPIAANATTITVTVNVSYELN